MYLIFLAFSLAAYFLWLIIYRLFFSPIRHVPGSKLAAVTGWCETYYDVFQGGQFTFKIEEWHKFYGECEAVPGETRC